MAAQYGQSGPTEMATVNCKGCGYDLRSHRAGDRCPECGRITSHRRKRDTPTHTDSGGGLLQLSILLAVIPLTGALNLPTYGAAIAIVAVFAPIFHLAGIWTFRKSQLKNIPEGVPWRKNWPPAVLELLVAGFAVWAVIDLQSSAVRTNAWKVVIVIWPLVAGIRCSMMSLRAAGILGGYGLPFISIIAYSTAALTFLGGIGIAVSSVLLTTQTSNSMLLLGMGGLVLFGGLGLICCWSNLQAVAFVEANLLWDIINQHIESKDGARELFGAKMRRTVKEELPPIPLADEEKN